MQPGEQRPVAPDAGAPDDVDRLFTHLTQLPAPRDFAANVLLAVQQIQQVRVYRLGAPQIAWVIAEFVAVILLAAIAFVAGQAFVGGGALALLHAVAADFEVLQLFPGDTLLSLAETIPWLELIGVALMTWVVVACTRRLGRALADPAARASEGAP
jgi:hypothetical protein